MTVREFDAIQKLNDIGGILTINYDNLIISFEGKIYSAQIEIGISHTKKIDLYEILKCGIKENLYQIEDFNVNEITEFKHKLENLL